MPVHEALYQCADCGRTADVSLTADWFMGYLDRTVHFCPDCKAGPERERLRLSVVYGGHLCLRPPGPARNRSRAGSGRREDGGGRR